VSEALTLLSRAFSNVDFAYVKLFTDESSLGTAFVRAVHFDEVRVGINTLRQMAGLEPIIWEKLNLSLNSIEGEDIRELRYRVNEVRASFGVPSYSYAEPIVDLQTGIKRDHLLELRSALR
jgi:hypothetical protein